MDELLEGLRNVRTCKFTKIMLELVNLQRSCSLAIKNLLVITIRADRFPHPNKEKVFIDICPKMLSFRGTAQ
jgi:hypothetical protein